GGLLLDESFEVGVDPVRVETSGRDERVEPCRRVAIRCARNVHERTQLLLAELAEVRCTLEGADLGPYPDHREIVGDGFGLVGEASVGPELAGIDPPLGNRPPSEVASPFAGRRSRAGRANRT